MRRAAAALAFLAAAAGPARAADWTVDPARSSLAYEVTVDGDLRRGVFGAWTAEISFDPGDLSTAKADVRIDMASAFSGNETQDKAAAGHLWFDAAGSPEARFTTAAFRRTGADAYEADGTLTIRGIERPVTLPFALTIAGGEAHMTARLTLDRTQWQVGQGSYASDTPVATAVDVVIDLTATAR